MYKLLHFKTKNCERDFFKRKFSREGNRSLVSTAREKLGAIAVRDTGYKYNCGVGPIKT
jgi:hypothetical protein